MNRFQNHAAARRCVFVMLCLCTLLFVQTVLTGCSKDDKEEEQLEVTPENLELDDSGKGTLNITSNTKWSVSTTADWLMFSTMSGVGDGQVTVRANGSSTDDRTAIVTIKGEGISRQTVVKQVAVDETPDIPETPFDNTTQIIKVGGVNLKMIPVEGGTFFMGENAIHEFTSFDDAKPVHSVTLSSYYIGETEVTQQLWQVVTGQKTTSDSNYWNQWNSTYGLGPNRPAYYISWDDCQEFIVKLNALTGRTFRLPTEAEWEFAARGGTKSKDYKYSGSNDIEDVAWYVANSYEKGKSSPDYGTHDVATKQPNELGLYDMSGNVWEWCSDWYDSGYYANSPSANPLGPSSGSDRVLRGGCWGNTYEGCSVSMRLNEKTDYRSPDIGLRLALQ